MNALNKLHRRWLSVVKIDRHHTHIYNNVVPQVLKSRKQGCPIIVSSLPKESVASYSLRNPSEVQSFLMLLARWGGDHSSL